MDIQCLNLKPTVLAVLRLCVICNWWYVKAILFVILNAAIIFCGFDVENTFFLYTIRTCAHTNLGRHRCVCSYTLEDIEFVDEEDVYAGRNNVIIPFPNVSLEKCLRSVNCSEL